MRQDIKYHVTSCHTCQVQNTKKMHLLINTTLPSFLFQEDISGVCEGRALAKDSAQSIALFFKEQILYHYGAISEVVTDNGPSLVGEFAKLAQEFNVKQIKISPYNSPANGVVEQGHYNIREALVKACNRDLSTWP